MKTTTLALILFLTGLDLWAQTEPTIRQTPSRVRAADINTNLTAVPPMPVLPVLPATPTIPAATPTQIAAANAGDLTTNAQPPEETIPAGDINFQGVDVSQVLEVYSKLVGRTLLRAGLPTASIILKTETPLTKSEAIEALQAVLALNGIAVVNVGDKFVKVLASADANSAGAAFNNADAANLPDMGSYVTRIVQLKYVKPSEIVPALSPFAKLNSIVPLDNNGILIIRDYAENIKRMLEMIDQVDVTGSAAEIVSEVIPIRYALADDIATALNSLGGSGSGPVRVGSSTAGGTGTVNGFGSPGSSTGGTSGGGLNNYQGGNGLSGSPQRGLGTTTANGTATGGATTFQQRLQTIIARAAGAGNGQQQQEQIQIFGQTKIIADERSNSLLIFATRQDMATIKSIIDKLDVLLAQVLIESVIMEVSLGNGISTGVSAVQNPSAINSPKFAGGGGYNNGPSFLSFLSNNVANVATNGQTSFANALQSGGLSYFGSLFGTDYQVAIQAAANDSSTTIIQKPRIQTFEAQKATFFVGQTVPYVTSTYNGGTTGIGSSFSQLSVGVELDVTPFINPDGLVVMEINEEIDDISGSTAIAGVGNVPNTDKRQLSSNVAVKDGDAIILGGAIRSEKDKSSSGVPFLQDIPLLGALFSAKTSSKSRDELLVLMRPTVLKTPDVASMQAKKEEERLPGIAHAEAQDNKDMKKEVEAEEKAEQVEAQKETRAAAREAKKHGGSSTNLPSSTMPDATTTSPDGTGALLPNN